VVGEAQAQHRNACQAKRVTVSVGVIDDAAHGVVADDGTAFAVAERDQLPEHLGLPALNGRSLLAGGWTRPESERGVGTKVEFRMQIK
jgi:signal transduction histidine kinase